METKETGTIDDETQTGVCFRCMLRMVDLRLFGFTLLSWILPFPVCTALCAQHANVISVVFPVVAAEGFCFPSNVPSDVVVVLALDTGLNVSGGHAVNRTEPKPELRLPRCHRHVSVRSCESLQWLGLCAFPECLESKTGRRQPSRHRRRHDGLRELPKRFRQYSLSEVQRRNSAAAVRSFSHPPTNSRNAVVVLAVPGR